MKYGIKDSRLVEQARSLRAEQTVVERKLWNRLRNRQLAQCKFRRQHPIAGYILDFACEELRLGIELDGNQHMEKQTIAYDTKRSEQLAHTGWRILRFWNNEVNENMEGVLTSILSSIHERQPC